MTSPEVVLEYHELGYLQREIAEILGVNVRTVARHLRRAGVPAQAKAVLSDEDHARIRYLSEVEGWPPEEIAATLGFDYTTTRDWVVPGPGAEWRNTAAALARNYPALYRELRQGLAKRKDAA